MMMLKACFGLSLTLWLMPVVVLAADQDAKQDTMDTYVAVGLEGLSIIPEAPSYLFGDPPEDQPSYDLTLGRSVAFSLRAADSYVVGLGLDFVGLEDLDKDLRRVAASVAWDHLILNFENQTLRGDLNGQAFTHPYRTLTLTYGKSGFLNGIGAIRFTQPRLSSYTSGYASTDVYDEENWDLGTTQTAVGYVMKVDSMLRALESGYVSMMTWSENDFKNDSGYGFNIDVMVLLGLAYVEPGDDFTSLMKNRHGIDMGSSWALATYSQAEAVFVYYKGFGDIVRLAVSAGVRARFVLAGGEPHDDVDYDTQIDLHFGPFARMGVYF